MSFGQSMEHLENQLKAVLPIPDNYKLGVKLHYYNEDRTAYQEEKGNIKLEIIPMYQEFSWEKKKA